MVRFLPGMGVVVLGAALLGGCASGYQASSAAAKTVVKGGVTYSTASDAYRQQVQQARDSKAAVCLQTDASSGRMIYRSLIVPSGSVQVQPEHSAAAWRCIDYGRGGQQIWAWLDPKTVGAVATAGPAAPVGKGLLGLTVGQTEDKRFLRVASLLPQGAAQQSGQLQAGDLIVAIGEGRNGEVVSTTGQTLAQTVARLRGEPGSVVRLTVRSPASADSREVVLTRRAPNAEQLAAIQRLKINALAIPNNRGRFLSPYTRDGVTAEWVDKAINVSMGKATGSAVGGMAGNYVANKALEKVPFGGMLGGFIGSKAGKAVGGNTALKAVGGWEFIRSSSDISFNTLNDMARWLAVTQGQNSNFADVVKAADKIYPGLLAAVGNAAR